MTSDGHGDDRSGRAPDASDGSPGTDLEAEWKHLPADPDLERHLGYEWIPFEVFGADENADQYRILPTDEGLLKRDAFVVVDPDCIEDLSEWA